MSSQIDRRITQLSVTNYRSLADVTFDLSDLVVLVGRNGSGKSNLVDVFRFLSEALTLGLDQAIMKRGGIGRIRRWSPKGRPYDVSIAVIGTTQDSHYTYSFTLSGDKRSEYSVKSEKLLIDGQTFFDRTAANWLVTPKGIQPDVDFPQTLVLPILSGLHPQITKLLREITVYSIYPNNLRPPELPTTPSWLSEMGDNIGSVIRELQKTPSWKAELISQISRLVPDVQNIEVRQAGRYFITRLQHQSGAWFDLEQESDGTLRLLGMAVALSQTPPRSLMLIEEPELAVHPGAMGVLCDLIKEASMRSQIIITTHSPDLIARFDVDALRIVEKHDDVTTIGKLDQHQREIVRDKLFSAGELLVIEGLRADSAAEPALLQ